MNDRRKWLWFCPNGSTGKLKMKTNVVIKCCTALKAQKLMFHTNVSNPHITRCFQMHFSLIERAHGAETTFTQSWLVEFGNKKHSHHRTDTQLSWYRKSDVSNIKIIIARWPASPLLHRTKKALTNKGNVSCAPNVDYGILLVTVAWYVYGTATTPSVRSRAKVRGRTHASVALDLLPFFSLK